MRIQDALQTASYFDTTLLVGPDLIAEEDGRWPFMGGADRMVHSKWFLTKAWHKFERQHRHKYGIFAAAQYRELMGVPQHAMYERYVALPAQWLRLDGP